MAASPSHIPRTLKKLREAGWEAEKVEQWVTFGGEEEERPGFFRKERRGRGFKRDFMGFADILGLDDYWGVHAVQVCARSGLAAHVRKIDEEPRAHTWLRNDNRITIWAWEKKGRFWVGQAIPLQRKDGHIVKGEV